MSIDKCANCGCLVDTDDEPESYVQVAVDARGNPDWKCFCWECRSEHEANELAGDKMAERAAKVEAALRKNWP